jgi:hypothetical protein
VKMVAHLLRKRMCFYCVNGGAFVVYRGAFLLCNGSVSFLCNG